MIDFPKLFQELLPIAKAVLTNKCSVIRVIESKGTAGGNTRSTSTVVTGWPCLSGPASSFEKIIAGQAQASVDEVVYLLGADSGVQLDVKGTDQIVIAASDAQSERTFSVTGAPRNHQGIIIEAPVALVE